MLLNAADARRLAERSTDLAEVFAGRDTFNWESTVAEQRERNVHVREGVSEHDFVAMREARDATLAAPTLILPSLQVNIRGGAMPDASKSGRVFLKIPITREETPKS